MTRFTKEYTEYISSDEWKQGWRRQITLKLVYGRCALFPLLKAQQADHLNYKHLKRELPLRDLVPLNSVCHELIITPLRGWLHLFFRMFLPYRLAGGAARFVVGWFLRGMVILWWIIPVSILYLFATH